MSVSSPPLVSIIIPTCNRSEYIYSVIKNILSHLNDVEIIVSDNSTTNQLKDGLAEYIYSGKIIYEYIEQEVSVVENFERAVAKATGEFVTCLGDDDSIGPGFNSVVNWALKHNIDAVYSYSHRFIANYFWPGVQSKYFADNYQARLFIKSYTGKVEKISTQSSLKEAAAKLGSGLGQMPRLYHGLVRRVLLNQIRSKYGSIFGGVSPDIYSAVLITIEAKKVYRIDAPFILPGGSPKSTAGLGAARADRSDLFSVDHIRRFGPNLKWSSLIPSYYSPHNVWAYSMLCALQTACINNININFFGLVLKNLLSDRSYFKENIISLRQVYQIQNFILIIFNIFLSIINEVKSITLRIYWRFFMKTIVFSNLNTIGDAFIALNEYEKNNNFKLSKKLDDYVL